MTQVEQYLISLDRFKVVKEVSHGSFGLVLLVEDKETQKKYAAKVTLLNDEDSREKILRSIQIMGEVHHPTLVNFIGYSPIDFEGKENITIITEYATNNTLYDLIKKGDYNNTQRQIILAGICRGMILLHQKHYIHRDLKPSNVLIDENFHPHVNDYTFMINYVPGTKYETNCGTPLFMAPEMMNDENGEYDYSVDVFAFAILMYQVVTGDLHVYDMKKCKSAFRLMKLVSEGERPEFTTPVKEPIQELIKQCWSQKPSDRLTFEQLFQKLAYDPEYYLENVDANKVKYYADSIKQ